MLHRVLIGIHLVGPAKVERVVDLALGRLDGGLEVIGPAVDSPDPEIPDEGRSGAVINVVRSPVPAQRLVGEVVDLGDRLVFLCHQGFASSAFWT